MTLELTSCISRAELCFLNSLCGILGNEQIMHRSLGMSAMGSEITRLITSKVKESKWRVIGICMQM